jgi:hypothetical protein
MCVCVSVCVFICTCVFWEGGGGARGKLSKSGGKAYEGTRETQEEERERREKEGGKERKAELQPGDQGSIDHSNI